jgi:hypothetical protein
MDDDTTVIPVFRDPDDAVTEETTTATFEGPSPFGLRPLPPPLEGERAYLVEVQAPRRPPGLLAIRSSLEGARAAAESVHPGVADVVIRELLLPCDAASLMRALAELRTWSRDAAGVWTPSLEAAKPREEDVTVDVTLSASLSLAGQTQLVGAFSGGE